MKSLVIYGNLSAELDGIILSSGDNMVSLSTMIDDLSRMWEIIELKQEYKHYRYFADSIVYNKFLMTCVKSAFNRGENIPVRTWQDLVNLIDKVNLYLTPKNRFATVSKDALMSRLLGKLGQIRFSKEKLMFEVDNLNTQVKFLVNNEVVTEPTIYVPMFSDKTVRFDVETDVNVEPFSDLYSVGDYKFVVTYNGRYVEFDTKHQLQMGGFPIEVKVSSTMGVREFSNYIGLYFQLENRQLYLTSPTKLVQLFDKDNREILINDDTIEGQALNSVQVQTRAGYTIEPQSFVYNVGLYKYVIEVDSKGIHIEKYSISEDKAIFNVSQISEDRIRLTYTSDVYDFKQVDYYVNGVGKISTPIQDVDVNLLDELFVSNNTDGTYRSALRIENNVSNFVYDKATRVLQKKYLG